AKDSIPTRRAASGLSPWRRYFSVSMSRWNASSASIRSLVCRGWSRAHRRRRQPRVRSIIAGRARGMSGSPENEVDRVDVLPPTLRLRRERAPPGRGETVVARGLIPLGRPPLALDPPLLLEALQRRVERALPDTQHTL